MFPMNENDKLDDAMRLVSDFTKRAMCYGFDSIQVLGTRIDDQGDTRSVECGAGNWYARMGVVKEFMNADRARTESFIEHSEFSIDPEEGEEF